MKLSRLLAVAATFAAAIASNTGAFADDRHDHHVNHHVNHGHARYYEGQRYQGHVLHQHNGRWGYYQPRAGSNIFISIPL